MRSGLFPNHADGNGNAMYPMNSSQTRSTSYRYDPYGNALIVSELLSYLGGIPNTYRFSSKMQDLTSGLCYYGYRWYAPNVQRWPHSDPLGEEGGINLYCPFGNDPIKDYDKFGLSAVCDARFAECVKGVNDGCDGLSKKLQGFNQAFREKADDLAKKCKNRCSDLEGWQRDNCVFVYETVFGGAKRLGHIGYTAGTGAIALHRGGSIQVCENVRANCLLDDLRKPDAPLFRIPLRPF